MTAAPRRRGPDVCRPLPFRRCGEAAAPLEVPYDDAREHAASAWRRVALMGGRGTVEASEADGALLLSARDRAGVLLDACQLEGVSIEAAPLILRRLAAGWVRLATTAALNSRSTPPAPGERDAVCLALRRLRAALLEQSCALHGEEVDR